MVFSQEELIEIHTLMNEENYFGDVERKFENVISIGATDRLRELNFFAVILLLFRFAKKSQEMSSSLGALLITLD